MRNFFINALERIVGVVVILGAVLVAVATIGALVAPQGGIGPAAAVLVGGTLYLLITGGLMYLALGIHANTKRTADLLERGATPSRDVI